VWAQGVTSGWDLRGCAQGVPKRPSRVPPATAVCCGVCVVGCVLWGVCCGCVLWGVCVGWWWGFRCGRTQDGNLLSPETALDGTHGRGATDDTVLAQLHKDGSVALVQSFCLDSQDSTGSHLVLGGGLPLPL